MKRVLVATAALVFVGPTFGADLTVYTYDSFVSEYGPGPKLEPAFEQRCGCDLVFVTAADGVSLLNRLRIERERTDADVVLGLDNALKASSAAGSFLRFLVSPRAQSLIPVTNWMLPVIADVELPPVFDRLIEPERIGPDSKKIAANREQWLRAWRRAASR